MRKNITSATAFRCLILSIFLCGHAAAQIPMESTLPGMKKFYRICKRNGKPAGYALSEVIGCERIAGDTLVVCQLEQEFDKHREPLTDEAGEAWPADTIRVRIVADCVVYSYEDLLGTLGEPLFGDPELSEKLREKGYSCRFKCEGDKEYRIPSRMEVGDTLSRFIQEDYLYNEKKGKPFAGATIEVVTYAACRETLDTPAGRFECVKVVTAFTCIAKVSFIRLRMRETVALWVSPGIGFVRMGELNKNGCLRSGYFELERLEMPSMAG